jgi:hypothetical protein
MEKHMKTVSDLLREADPANEDSSHLDDARVRIRRTVVAVASDAQLAARRAVRRRQVLVGAVGTAAATFAVIGLIVGSGGQGTLRAAVRLEVRLAETRPAPGLIVARVADSARVIYVHPETVVSNDDIAQSWVTQDGPDRFGVSVQLLEPGAQRMHQATAAHIGRPVAIMIDGEVVSAPVVRSAIGNAAIITGDFTQAEAERIAGGIQP